MVVFRFPIQRRPGPGLFDHLRCALAREAQRHSAARHVRAGFQALGLRLAHELVLALITPRLPERANGGYKYGS